MPPRSRAAAWARRLLGDPPWIIVVFVSPTLAAFVFDLVVRPRALADMRAFEYLNYFGSAMVACGLWGPLLWGASRLAHLEGASARTAGRAAFALFFAAFVFPMAMFSFGGQALYYLVFHSYMARDTLRIGLSLRGTAGAWIAEWSWRVLPVALLVVAGSILLARQVFRAGPRMREALPIVPVIGFVASFIALSTDYVETRALQAAPPDVCFWHALMGLVRDGLILHKGAEGLTIRQPRPLPPIEPPARRRNVLLIVTESVRADALCSAPALRIDRAAGAKFAPRPSGCNSSFLDQALPDRVGLVKMTTQAPSTFSACMMAWTGLPPDSDMRTCHEAPFLWEVARAAGYQTAYITSQNLRYQDLSAYVKVSGADVTIAGADLGGVSHPHLGAPDELATARMVEWAAATKRPWFVVLHLSNTHWPYRSAPDLEPFTPHSDEPPRGDVLPYLNQYKNGVLFQERTLAEMFTKLRELPAWDDTFTLFVSDHGEQFREHGRLYHINNLFEEEVRVPSFAVAGSRALSDAERLALAGNRVRRAYSQDVHATVLDALGVLEARPAMPFADRLTGRSLLRPLGPDEPIVAMSTTTGVWADHDPVYGVMQGETKMISTDGGPWTCFNLSQDRGEHRGLPGSACPDLLSAAKARYPNVTK